MAGRDLGSVAALARKLQLLSKLDAEDLQEVANLTMRTESIKAGNLLVREGDVPEECCLLVDGFACRHKIAVDGGRQIVSFHVRGDILDLQHLYLSVADHSIQSITAATVAWIPMDELRNLALSRPAIGVAFWRDSLIDASIFREWVLNVGRRDARTRIAHMLCEFIARCEAAGLGSARGFDLPLTQEQIGDATGLTPVHVNRMIRSLREAGVIEISGGYLRVLDWSGLRDLAGFDPAYLHSAAA